jgi:hypothetical protein
MTGGGDRVTVAAAAIVLVTAATTDPVPLEARCFDSRGTGAGSVH